MIRIWSKDELANLFGLQIKTLRYRENLKEEIKGFEENRVLSALGKQKDQVIEKASEMAFENRHTPFMPAFSCADIGIHVQMSMIRYGNETGYTDLERITDMFKAIPVKPYYFFDIEDGGATQNRSYQDAEKLIKKQGRRGLTGFEIIALGIHADVLFRHYVYAIGSRCGSSPFEMPALWLFDGRPKLSGLYIDYPLKKWGTPSCENEYPEEKKIEELADKREERVRYTHGVSKYLGFSVLDPLMTKGRFKKYALFLLNVVNRVYHNIYLDNCNFS